MKAIIDPEVLARLIEELDAKHQRLSEMHRDYDTHLQDCARQRERISSQINHLKAIQATYATLEQADRCLGAPAPGQVVEEEETMYLGATPEESFQPEPWDGKPG